MKLLISQPLEIYIQPSTSLTILLFPTFLYFADRLYLQQYLAKCLHGYNPKILRYSQQTEETIIVTENTIEIFYCQLEISLVEVRRIVILEVGIERVFGVKGVADGWQVYGKFLGYSQQGMKLVKVWSGSVQETDKTAVECWVGDTQFFIQNKRLYKIIHSQSKTLKTEIQWKQRLMVISNCKDHLTIAAMQNSLQQPIQQTNLNQKSSKTITSLPKSKSNKSQFYSSSILASHVKALCISQTYILLLKAGRVHRTVQRNHIFYFGNDLILSGVRQFKVDRLTTSNQIQQLGVTSPPQGTLYAAGIFGDELFFMHYSDEYLTTKCFKLVPTANESPEKDRKSLHLSFDDSSFNHRPIPQEANQSGSQLLNPRDIRPSAMSGREHRDKEKGREFEKEIEQEWQINLAASDHSANNSPSHRSLKDLGIEKDKVKEIHKGQYLQKESLTNIGIHFDKREDNNSDFIKESSDLEIKDALRQEESYDQVIKEEHLLVVKVTERMKDRDHLGSELKEGQEQFEEISQIHFKEGDTWAQYMRKMGEYPRGLIQSKISNYQVQHDQNKTKKKDSLNDMIQNSQKVQAFSNGRVITPELRQYIQKKSYSQLIMEEHNKKRIRHEFEEYLGRFLPKILQEQQSCTLFSEHIRTYNPEETKKILIEVYSNVKDTEQNRRKFMKVLRDFRLNQIPRQFLNLPQNVVDIMEVLYPQIFILDLLEPSGKIFADLLEDYLMKDQLQVQQVRIEDEYIDITHPRNLLNVLLYLDQTFQVPLLQIFSIYITKILRFGHIQISRRLLQEQQVLTICEVSPKSLQKSIREFIFQYLRQSCLSLAYTYDVISLLQEDGQICKEMLLIHSIIENMNEYDLTFSVTRLFSVRGYKNGGQFLGTIIVENSPKNLANVDLVMLYKKVYNLQQDTGDGSLQFYNYELIQLTQSLAERLIDSGLIHQCFVLLDPIASEIPRGFFGKLLYQYLQGKMLHRLINCNFKHTTFLQIFPQIMLNHNITCDSLPSSTPLIPEQSLWLSCTWQIFQNIFESVISFSQDIVEKIIVYYDLKLAVQLVQYEVFISVEDFRSLMEELVKLKYLKRQIPSGVEKPHPEAMTTIALIRQEQTDRESGIVVDLKVGGQSKHINFMGSIQNTNKMVTKSLIEVQNKQTQIWNYLQGQQNSIRAKSDQLKQNSLQNDNSTLSYLQILVQEQVIISVLRQIYHQSPRYTFLRALKIVQKQRIKLYYCQTYKALHSLNLQYPFQRVIPFQIFLIQNPKHAFIVAKNLIMSEIDMKNFWIVYLIVSVMFGEEQEVTNIYSEKMQIQHKSETVNQIGLRKGQVGDQNPKEVQTTKS